MVLFDGTDTSKWSHDKWKIEEGHIGDAQVRVAKNQGFVWLSQAALEFATPKVVKGDSQGRGNSGVFLNGRYEVQVPTPTATLVTPMASAPRCTASFRPR